MSFSSTALAIPKSITLATGFPSWHGSRMFDGLMSRWITPFWWACWTARQTNRCRTAEPLLRAEPVLVAVLGDRDPSHQFHHERTGRPCPVAPASKTLAMLGWSIIASAWRSASKRATTSLVSIPSLMIFPPLLLSRRQRRMGMRPQAYHWR